jgi:hypothetical protein
VSTATTVPDRPRQSATPDAEPSVLTEVLAGHGLSLAQAARRFPPARRDRPVSPSCVWRWMREGVRLPSGERLRLEGCRISGRWLTSEPALLRFLMAQQADDSQTLPSQPRTTGRRHRDSERAAAELERLGVR